MDETIAAMKSAFTALSAGKAVVPLRSHLEVPGTDAVNLFMPAFLESASQPSLAIKIVAVRPQNPTRGLPMIHAAVVVIDAKTGEMLAMLEGGSLTAIRTGAGSGAATDFLARRDSHQVAIFGAGVQARTQLEAVCTVRKIEEAWVYDPNRKNVDQFIQEMTGKDPIPAHLHAADTPAQAASNADIICTATTSTTPVFPSDVVRPGTHINGVGSFTPAMQEIPANTVLKATVVVDSREAALAEAGDLIQLLANDLITEAHIQAEIGEVIAGTRLGRTSQDQITFYKSVGVAVQDAAAAQLALSNARTRGLGQPVDW
jgi:ornithine cyclodeaminase